MTRYVIHVTLAGAMLAVGYILATAAASASTEPVNLAQLSTFVDSTITAEMAREKIPGAVFVYVQNGRVVLKRGYGMANAERRSRVVVDSTIWRIGSISKVFTATAVVQLSDRGRVSLDAPVDRYVQRVKIPATYPEPVTVRDLLDHTAGFDEIRPGTQASTRDSVLPLDKFLEGRLVRIRPPGRTTAYSTYGITLAGELVEEVSGESYEAYLARNVWKPLGMSRTCITVPQGWARDVAVGYELEGDSLVAQPWEWYHTIPASSINATATDMAQFMLAHLGKGALHGGRILSAKATGEMHRQQATMDPRLPGFALGFYEDYVGGLRVLEHGGNMAGFSALMVLIPEANAGFFVVNQLEGSRLRDNLKYTLLERFFPRARERKPVPSLPSPAQVNAKRFVGRYAPLPSCWSCQPTRVWSVMEVKANDDGTLSLVGGRWVATDSLCFVRDSGSGYIAFRTDSTGSIAQLFAGSYWGWQRLPE